ncbi:MAG: cyclic nucleotide-binding domain-containing protein [Deltaproteobacteria bacterium]|nr:cyclic nucleotide-binding domain-containing protein [Deltaproteobacteria bacterium]
MAGRGHPLGPTRASPPGDLDHHAYTAGPSSALLLSLEAIGLFEEITTPQGTILFREGDIADANYILATGSVDITVGERRLARLAPGETFGMGYDADQPRPATATAALGLPAPRAAAGKLAPLQRDPARHRPGAGAPAGPQPRDPARSQAGRTL